MWKILKTRFDQGCRTLRFPRGNVPCLPARYRGRPIIASDLQAVDMGTITFSPDSSVVYSQDHRMASSGRKDLVLKGQEQVLVQALDARMLALFGRSLKLRQVSAGGCNACELDLNVLNTPVFDLSRFGIQFVASPRHADGLVVTGPVTPYLKEALLKTYEAVPDPKIVIAVGSCSISGGIFADGEGACGGIEGIIPVDLFIPGCPPHPLTILDGMLRLLARIKE